MMRKRIVICMIICTFAALFVFTIQQRVSASNSVGLTQLRDIVKSDNNAAFFEISLDTLLVWDKDLSPKLRDNKEYDVMFRLKKAIIDNYISEGNWSQATDNAKQLYEAAKELDYKSGLAWAYMAIGDAYLNTNMVDEANSSYEEAYNALDNSEVSSKIKLQVIPKLIMSLIDSKEFEDAVKYLKIYDVIPEITTDPQNYFFLNICHAAYYIETNNAPIALQYLQAAKQFIDKNPTNQFCGTFYRYYYAQYLVVIKDYQTALDLYESILVYGNVRNITAKLIQINLEKANVLLSMSRVADACSVYRRQYALKDSLNSASYTYQVNSLRGSYTIDKLELESQAERNRIIFWAIAAGVLILILFVLIVMYNRRENIKLKKSRLKLEEAQKLAEKSIRTKSALLSNMSHELRTPLNALSGFASILAEDGVDDEMREQCNEVIQQNSVLLLKLVSDVVEMSDMEMGKLNFTYSKCDAITVCNNVVNSVEKVKQTQAAVKFETSLTELTLDTDGSRLQQVLINLLINATKFTKKGSITLSIEPSGENMVMFAITDTGCGIPLDKQGSIFTRFEKVNEESSGTGIGLSICQIIVEHVGGKIWIDPEYTEGARFVFTHPIENINNNHTEE